MTPEQFCYWLQGRAELQPNNPPSEEEWAMIVIHLQTVFHKRTPQIRYLKEFPTTDYTQPTKTVSVMQKAQEMQHGFNPPVQC